MEFFNPFLNSGGNKTETLLTIKGEEILVFFGQISDPSQQPIITGTMSLDS